LWLYERQLALARMHNQAEAERRLRILIFWEKHGDGATAEAFRVSRRTLYRWQEALRHGEGKVVALDKRSTAPKKKNIRRPNPALVDRIVALRTLHHLLGKRKLTPILRAEGFQLSEPYVGRVLTDLKKRGLLPKYKTVRVNARTGRVHERVRTTQPKIRRPKEKKRGMEIDTVVRFIGSTKRYILTAIDVEKRFAFAAAYTNHSSAAAADFLGKLIAVSPFPVTEIQSDNGSEFAHLFHDACAKQDIRHYHTYPRCPKMNGTVERFNRTLSEEFVQHHLTLLKEDISAFNEKLIDYLLWYNGERPHESLFLKSPLQCIVASLSAEECQMWWTYTFT
jgi:transposase InsO family protein